MDAAFMSFQGVLQKYLGWFTWNNNCL